MIGCVFTHALVSKLLTVVLVNEVSTRWQGRCESQAEVVWQMQEIILRGSACKWRIVNNGKSRPDKGNTPVNRLQHDGSLGPPPLTLSPNISSQIRRHFTKPFHDFPLFFFLSHFISVSFPLILLIHGQDFLLWIPHFFCSTIVEAPLEFCDLQWSRWITYGQLQGKKLANFMSFLSSRCCN